ncbi:MAG: hypothetical protein LPK19_16375 [Hymenobacteraceae bacterium]|nr:hypothetical protein [Hymenobacteraceae bacterium]MDX5397820.1 hypothetical protein [Hymenobacteraceae bacterium]MDX5513899.1 hypothetical protein [Hymenobacteraceae bacterium]
MPLYKKAISFTTEDLEKMSLQECEEVLLALRYLAFRESDDNTKEEFLKRIKQVEAQIETLKRQPI